MTWLALQNYAWSQESCELWNTVTGRYLIVDREQEKQFICLISWKKHYNWNNPSSNFLSWFLSVLIQIFLLMVKTSQSARETGETLRSISSLIHFASAYLLTVTFSLEQMLSGGTQPSWSASNLCHDTRPVGALGHGGLFAPDFQLCSSLVANKRPFQPCHLILALLTYMLFASMPSADSNLHTDLAGKPPHPASRENGCANQPFSANFLIKADI